MRLTQVLTPDHLRSHLPAPGSWNPVPDVTDREFWLGRDATTRAGLIRQAEERAAGPWPVLTAGLWRDYARTGNRVHYEDPYFARRDRFAAAVLAAALTDEERWLDEVTDGIWQLCEETTWCIPPHERSTGVLPDPDRPTLDLFAAETGAVLAWTHAILGPRLSPVVAHRLAGEVRRRVLVPHRTIDDFVWIGLDDRHVNNWNPWINSNVLACSFLLDTDPADILLTAERAVRGLERFMADYPPDGGCSEGAQYWWRAPASLFECLQTLYDASGGALNALELPLLAEMGRYLHRVHIDGEWYVNVADGPARLDRFNAAAHLLHRYGRAVHDPDMAALGRSIRGTSTVVETQAPLGRSLARTLLALADDEWAAIPDTPAPYLGQVWLPDTQLLVAREKPGSKDGLLCSVKGGHNAEDHNHNDVGSFVIALDGHPAVIDVGVAAYTRKHFGPQRYEIWTLRSDYHNVPQINGHEQAPGREFAARDVRAELSEAGFDLRMDLAPVYPNDIQHWWRRVRFDRSAAQVRLTDSWELPEEPATLVSHLMVSGEPRRVEDRIEIPTPGRALRIGYPDELEVEFERIELEDRRLRWVWGDAVWRLTFTATAPERTGSWDFQFGY
ncbi:MAG TPA: heparinase II/III family protein [Mycobacteriales bacterium]|nr:heparinase II/III family protein [Mycobacteriales bacterium]